MDSQYITKEGLEKIKAELEERTGVVRPGISKKILEATGHGDLSENAEYTEAKEIQAFNEGRIEEIESIIRNAVIIEHNKKSDIIVVGCTVKVKSKEFGEQKFTIVGPSESAPADGLISNESPLGSAFLDRRKGDDIKAKTPKGVVAYKVLDIL